MPSTKPAHKHEFESQRLEKEWKTDARWKGITRPYKGADVVRLRGSVRLHHTLAFLGAKKLWHLVNTERVMQQVGVLALERGETVAFLDDPTSEFPEAIRGENHR